MANKTVLVGKASTTMSSAIGGVTGALKQHFVEKFPKGYFKTFFVDTTLASISMAQANESGETLVVPKMPILVMSPKYDLNSETAFRVFPQWIKALGYVHTDTFGNYRRVLVNDEDGYYIFSSPHRLKVSFDMKLRVSSRMAAMDVLSYLKQSFYMGGYYYLNNTKLETEVPKTFIKMMMDDMAIDTSDPASVQDFNKYLRDFSQNTINVKNNVSSGNSSYSYEYLANMLVRMPNPPDSNVNSKDMSTQSVDISFNMEVELWVPANFIFQTDKILDEPEFDHDVLHSSTLVLNYSIRTEPPQVRGDKQLLNWQGFVSDVNVEIDRLPLSSLLEQSVLDIISYNNSIVRDNYEVFDLILYRDEILLTKDKDYIVDWDLMELQLLNPYQNYTHHVGIYGNIPLLQDIYVELSELVI